MPRTIRALAVLTLASFVAACASSGSGRSVPAVSQGVARAQSGSAAGLSDDWITFAHDYLRTGFQAQNVGLSKKTVHGLVLRWKRNTGQNMYNAPLVYAGNLIAASSWFNKDMPGIVYDYASKDGRLLWKHTLDGEIRATPSIDPAQDLVLVSTRHITASGAPLPGTLFALDLTNGRTKWSVKIPGLTRGAAVIANDRVFIGTAGGDPPYCLNGGVSAYEETTGRHVWTWHVNAQNRPGGGGSAWGPLAYDGAHLIFGTGNTCQAPVTTANGAAELNGAGKLQWSFVAVANSKADEDTGGGITLSNGQAIFINKNGSAYSLAAADGHETWTKALGASGGNGGFATASTDGSTTLLGTGLLPDTPAQKHVIERHEAFCPIAFDVTPHTSYHSNLVALDTHGSVLWTLPSTQVIVGYAAIVNGIAFVGLGDEFSALDVRTGKTLWTYEGANAFLSSPAVVPSGVYTADFSGNVYAFSLPAGR
jgi:hypothetical protein